MTRHMTAAQVIDIQAQARSVARAVGLHYVNDADPGFRRQRKRGKFQYADADARELKQVKHLARIRALAIPPAWTDVWICPFEHGHIQATGRDARGRKQYRYHAAWSKARDAAKHARMCDFASRLGVIRARCQHYLRKRGLPREKVLAALVRVVDLTAIRVGHEEYARANNSFGLTTLRVRHVRIRGATVELSFRGKSGIQRRLQFQDRALAQVFTRCRALGGGHMFKFNDEQGRQRRVTAEHVNAFLRELLGRNGHHYSIKDFRTWSATVRVAVELAQSEPAASQRAMRKQLLEAVRKGAEHLGNTAAICRKSYVHPLIFEAYAQGRVVEVKAEASLLAQEDSVRRFLLSLMQPAAVARASR